MIPRIKIVILFLIIFFILIFPASFQLSTLSVKAYISEANLNLRGVLEFLNYSNVKSHVTNLTSFESRVTGYPGCSAAADYIYHAFERYGLSVWRQQYSVAVPIDHGADVSILNEDGLPEKVIEAYAIWPNLIQTSRIPRNAPLEGFIRYVDDGDLEDFDDKKIEGAIVLMEFNSKYNWVNAAKLGAKGVIFIAPSETAWNEARSKILITPIHFPRLYISIEDGIFLKELALSRETKVRIVSDMGYETIEAENVIGAVNGTLYPEDIIVVAAHYDTWSVVPRIAPGADESTAIASLLELSRYFAKNPPKRTLWFVALSGHYQALAGGREFTERFFFDRRVELGERKIWAFMGLDFSTDSEELALLYRGHFYDFGGSGVVVRWTRWLGPRIFETYLPNLEEQTGKRYDVQNGFHPSGDYGWWASISVPYMIDSEPIAIAHGLGFTLRTNNVLRLHWGHPFNTIEKINYENLWPQVEVASAIVYGLANEETINMEYSIVAPSRYLFTAAGGDMAGFLTVKGNVVVYNVSKGWYNPVSNSIVCAMRIGQGYSSYPFNRIITITDESGRFTIHGVSGYGYGHGYGIVDRWYFEAYHINESTGFIDYSPDLGQYGRREIAFSHMINRNNFEVTTVVFECASAVIFDLIDPTTMKPRVFFDPRFESGLHTWSSNPSSLIVYEFSTKSEYIKWGQFLVDFESVAMIFVPSETRFMLVYRVSTRNDIAGILLNATRENPEGQGFFAKAGKETHISTAHQFAHDLFFLTMDRYSTLEAYSVRSPVIESTFNNLIEHLNNAQEALRELKYDKADAESVLAWSWAVPVYQETMKVIYDTMNVSMIFYLIAVIFTLFFERLILEGSGWKRAVVLSITFITLLVIYWYLHPAPKLATNSIMTPLSITILLLFIFTFILLLDKILSLIREVKVSLLGRHFAERTTMSLAIISFSQGPRNMKKRKLRTGLVMVSVLTLTFSMVSLTSLIPTLEVKSVPLQGYNATYEGLLMKRERLEVPGNVLDPRIIDSIKGLVSEAIIAPRIWLYPQSKGGERVYASIKGDGESYTVRAILGLSSNEIDLYTENVQGRWIGENDYFVCILSKLAAERLHVDVGETISLDLLKLLVIGIYDSTAFNLILDLDKYAITPINPDPVTQLSLRQVVSEGAEAATLSWDDVIVVPHQMAYDLGGYIASIAVRASDPAALEKIGSTFALTLHGVKIYIGRNGQVHAPSSVGWFGLLGWETLAVPIAIGAFTILNTLIGEVKERENEIKIYSSIGLSPKSIILIFLTEAAVYALTSGLIGYILGLATNLLLVNIGHLPPDFIVNSSSVSAMIAIAVCMISVFLGTIYPSFLASKLITPSLERKWKVPKPKGDEWEVPLPFYADSEGEVEGVLNYMKEFLQAYMAESDMPFIVRDVELSLANKKLLATMLLLPAEAGVTQEMLLQATLPKKGDRWIFILQIKKLTGLKEVWSGRNYRFIDILRKQFLMWRSFREEERLRYMKT